ncbi:hypothetical protein BDD12DRAFT_900614 [Trichophaea hybrida]|nr:hypothetical protein BDD12DRAFT_900614 [Trichophaea hybrida]
MNETTGTHVAPQVPARSTSLTAPPRQTPQRNHGTSRFPGQPSEAKVRLAPGTQHQLPPLAGAVQELGFSALGVPQGPGDLIIQTPVWVPETAAGGRFIDPERVKAAHIYPFVLGTTVMRMIFGEQAVGELFHVRNGLLLSDSVEKRFDKHQVVIVPANGAKLQADGTIDRWILKLVDDAVKNIPMSDIGTLADLHGRELQFRTTARPAARYLYFHYLLAMLRVRKRGRKIFRPQKTNDPVDIESRPVPWGTPGPYILERMVRALIAEAGHDVFQEREFDQIAIPENNPPGIEEKALGAHLVALPQSESDEGSY